ncbi:MAG TPA: DUF3786 domain-containing protein [Sedimentisphaerales bacterium]|nr:DUF3786 domain-containing protein [Sedimentisphaerales bacterium]
MAHTELWEQLGRLDRQTTAKTAKCQYKSNPERYVIQLLNTEYEVSLADRQVLSVKQGCEQMPAGFLRELCILAYLINARDLPLADKLVKAESLPGGEFFFRGQHGLPTDKLEEAFGEKPALLYEAGARLNAKKRDFGDASVELLALPRIPLTFIIWRSDEEFGPRASILFDQTAAGQLPLDALLALTNIVVDALTKTS